MVKPSIRMMGCGLKYHLDCYLQQKKNSSIFSKKDFLNCCNDKPSLFFHLSNEPSDAWKLLKKNSLAKYNAFSLINTPFKPFEHGFVDLIIGISFHQFNRSTPLLKRLKDFTMWKLHLLEQEITVQPLCWFWLSPAPIKLYI